MGRNERETPGAYKGARLLNTQVTRRQVREETQTKTTTSSVLFSVAILAETAEIKQLLQKHDIHSETLEDLHPIRVQPSTVLSHIYARLGRLS